MKIRKLVCIFLLGMVTLSACKKNDSANKSQDDPTGKLNGLSITDVIKLVGAGFDPSFTTKTTDGYLVEGDIFVSNASLRDPRKITGQYMTDDIVENYDTIRLKVNDSTYTGWIAALDNAIDRYNGVKLKLTFVRVPQDSTAEINLVPYVFPDPATLGQSVFPTADKKPGSEIKLKSTKYPKKTEDYTGNELSLFACVITHEIGHAVGMRHTDAGDRTFSCLPNLYGNATFFINLAKYTNRQMNTLYKINWSDADWNSIRSTYNNRNEFAFSPAANIPGTPATANGDPGSWMLACMGDNDRPFTKNDTIALKYLYPVK